MTNRPRKHKRAIRVFALAAISCLALAAASASTASALSLKPTAEPPAFPLPFSVSAGTVYTDDYPQFSCTEGTFGEGSLEHEDVGSMALTLTGCSIPTAGPPSPCTSPGAESGTVVTEPLSVDLVTLPDEEPGVLAKPISPEKFAEFTCLSGLYKIEWTGGVIGKITEPGYEEVSNALLIDFAGGEGEQEYTETLDGREARLERHKSGGEGVDISLNADLELELAGAVALSPEDPEETYLELMHPNGFPGAAAANWLTFTQTVIRAGGHTIACAAATKEEEFISGEGEFDDPSSGEVAFTFHGCKESAFNSNCTTSGQSPGTVKTDSLQVQLAYLSDGSPGVRFLADPETGRVAKLSCIGGFVNIVLTGGVLGSIIAPEVDGASFWLGDDINVIEEGEEYVQEHTEDYDGGSTALGSKINGGAEQPATLDLLTYAVIPGGGVTLRGNLAE